MKEQCPICLKDNYVMPGLPSHIKTHSHDELANFIIRVTEDQRKTKTLVTP